MYAEENTQSNLVSFHLCFLLTGKRSMVVETYEDIIFAKKWTGMIYWHKSKGEGTAGDVVSVRNEKVKVDLTRDK